MPETWSGRQIGDFIVEERIARGGLSTIYRARQVSVNRFVALKIIDLGDDIPDREAFRQAFEREVAITASLEHIHILPVYGYGMVDTAYAYIAMRLLSGGSLADKMKNAPLPMDQVADLLDNIAQGLDYAHRKGVLHGDLKPSNILLDDAGRAYLSDFGVASVIANAIDPMVSQSLNKLPLYVAPERLRGAEGDARADIYSVGAILYHVLTGKPPFEMDDGGLGSLLFRQLEQDPIPPRTFNPNLPPAIEGLIMRALRKNPSDRFATLGDLTRTFNTALGKSTLSWEMPSALTRVPPRRLWFIPLVLLLLTAVALVLIVLLRPALPTTQLPIVMLEDAVGTVDTLVPTQNDIDRARAVLGEDGMIAYLNCTLDDVQFASRSRYAREVAEALGLRIVVYDAQNDLYQQLTQIEQARLEGARAIILCPAASSGLEESVAELQMDDIPLVWATLADTEYGVKLDSDNYAIGQSMGEYAGHIFADEFVGQADYIIISRAPFPASVQRRDGILEAIQRIAPQANYLGELAAGNRELLDAAESDLSELLANGTVPDAVLCVSDSCAYGATNALSNAGISTDDVFIISASAEPFTLDLIRAESYLRATVAIDRRASSGLMVYAIIEMLAGHPVPELLRYPPGDIITEANVSSYDPNT